MDNLVRVSGTGGNGRGVCHFVSEELLWSYFFLYFETGAGEKGFLRARNMFSECIFGQAFDPCSWKVFQKAWEIFIHAISWSTESQPFDCSKCPAPLDDDAPADEEEKYDDIECHVMDGIGKLSLIILLKCQLVLLHLTSS